jgi:dTDP-4-dehydrorhamnose 3,5-epimerase
MEFKAKSIPGLYEIRYPVHRDRRGLFVKPFLESAFTRQGIKAGFKEVFYSISGDRVLRGMHVQVPPADQEKLVYCAAGDALEVLLDLRVGSPQYGKFETVELTSEAGHALYVPRGVAHGFYVRKSPVIMMYHVTSEHVPALDRGIAWDSFGAPWPNRAPVLSERDASLPPFAEFESPFRFAPDRHSSGPMKPTP